MFSPVSSIESIKHSNNSFESNSESSSEILHYKNQIYAIFKFIKSQNSYRFNYNDLTSKLVEVQQQKQVKCLSEISQEKLYIDQLISNLLLNSVTKEGTNNSLQSYLTIEFLEIIQYNIQIKFEKQYYLKNGSQIDIIFYNQEILQLGLVEQTLIISFADSKFTQQLNSSNPVIFSFNPKIQGIRKQENENYYEVYIKSKHFQLQAILFEIVYNQEEKLATIVNKNTKNAWIFDYHISDKFFEFLPGGEIKIDNQVLLKICNE